jgi:hypothetical protein
MSRHFFHTARRTRNSSSARCPANSCVRTSPLAHAPLTAATEAHRERPSCRRLQGERGGRARRGVAAQLLRFPPGTFFAVTPLVRPLSVCLSVLLLMCKKKKKSVYMCRNAVSVLWLRGSEGGSDPVRVDCASGLAEGKDRIPIAARRAGTCLALAPLSIPPPNPSAILVL